MTSPAPRLRWVSSPPPAFSGSTRFRPLSLLGQGARGFVYRVFDVETGSEVALKTLAHRTPDELYHLKQEFRTLASLVHPNLVELYELLVGDQHCFFTMEVIEGCPFTDFLRRPAVEGGGSARASAGAPLRFLQAARQLALGVDAVHAAGKLHRDIKPPNVLVTAEGRTVILDFGLATGVGLSPDDCETHTMAGTFEYMAPEQAWGAPPSAAADWYSVGVMLYEALTGRLPFEGSPARMLRDKERGTMVPPSAITPGLPPALEALVCALLRAEADRRPGAEEILRTLEAPAPRLAPATRTPFVGRTSELARLRAAFDEACRGRAAVARVRGPSGIGKSELVRRFVEEIERAASALVLAGRCHHQEVVPYKAMDQLVDALSRVLGSLPAAERARLAPRGASALLRLFPVLGCVAGWGDGEVLDAEAEPHEIRRQGFVALRDLLARLAVARPLVLWIDDAQWSDPDSASLLRELSSGPERPPVLLLLSYRDDGAVPLPLDAEESASDAAPGLAQEIIDVPPLAPEESLQLARRLGTPRHDSDEWLAAVLRAAGGNPFFIGEIARSSGGGEGSAGRQLAEVVAARLEQLRHPARRLLELVCVAGRPIPRGVLLEAAGLDQRARPVVGSLEKRFLVRTTIAKEERAIDIYHDRQREIVLAGLTPEALRWHHGSLADAFARDAQPNAAALFHHTRGAGRNAEAAQWAIRAADRAADALAFVEAADLYEQAALLGSFDEARATELLVRRADSLANAGHCASAAPLFRAAASRVDRAQSFELRRRAVSQFLISGHIDEGVREMRSLLAELGLRYPRSPGRALLAMGARALQVAAFGLDFEERREADVPREALARIDTCHFAAQGLLPVDTARGAYFALQSLRFALRTGEARRVARDLAALGAVLVPTGGALGRVGRRLIDRASAIAERDDDPRLRANILFATANARLMEARWRDMIGLCDAAIGLLTSRCRGVTAEVNLARMVAIRALEEVGDLLEVRRRTEELVREAESLGDLYAGATANIYAAYWRIGLGDTAGARLQSRSAVGTWTRGAYSLQHLYVLRNEVCCDLYDGEAERALARLEVEWPEIRRSNLLRHSVMRGDAHGLRGRARLAAVAGAGRARARLLSGAERDAHVLEQSGRPDTRAHADLLRAGVAAARGDLGAARALLAAAASRYDGAEMRLAAACARRRLGECTAGPEGGALVRAAEEFLLRSGLRDPRRWLEVQAPGFRAAARAVTGDRPA